jgi:poly(A) polymerase
MIRKLIDKLLGKPSTPKNTAKASRIPLGRRVEIPASEHGIDPSLLDERAVKVVTTLQQAGYEAYIVGGAVRDLLVGRRPKDFDVATDATPEQVKSLFRRAFIIGRRFRIVHVVFGRGREHEVIEVSTFRAYLDNTAAEQVEGNEKTARNEIAGKTHVVDASGRVLRDNVWGPQVEDAARRDFTINAMYYNPATQVVVDYHGGLKDLRAQVLRMIGDPETRYREDPVRILRVVRFAAKLGFKLEAKTEKPLRAMLPLLANVPVSRMFDEMIKLLQTGHALASLEQIKHFGLDHGVFPVLDAALSRAIEGGVRDRFLKLSLADTDRRVSEGKPVAPSFLLACLLWHDVQEGWSRRREEGEHPSPALSQAIDAAFDARIGDISGRGKLATDMREIWMMQPRFERRTGSQVFTLVEQPRFRAGFDFLRLRADIDEVPVELVEWWEDFSLGTDEEREALVASIRELSKSGRKGVGGAKRPKAAMTVAAGDVTGLGEKGREPDESEDLPPQSDDQTGEINDAPRKRRRRRRKPVGRSTPNGSEGPSE